MTDFFISYTQSDTPWAEWVAWTLEAANYTVVFQAWDFRIGGNFVLDMHDAILTADRTLALLSTRYLAKPYPQPEWAAAFAQDPTSRSRTLIPIRLEPVIPPGLLKQIVYVDLFDCDEPIAQQRLLNSVQTGRMKPDRPPQFPGQVVSSPKPFPGKSAAHPRRSNQRRQILENERSLRLDKLQLLRNSWAIETQAAVKFQLQHQIQDEENQIETLERQINAGDH
jgi:TIR domain